MLPTYFLGELTCLHYREVRQERKQTELKAGEKVKAAYRRGLSHLRYQNIDVN
jgi:hypothetical protein